MYNLTSQFIMYNQVASEGTLLDRLSRVYEKYEKYKKNKDDDKKSKKSELVREVYDVINNLLKIATTNGFDGNLWQNYLTYLIITDENSFSIVSEKQGAKDGTVNDFAMNDFGIFRELFAFNFSGLEEYLGINCFTKICNYKSIKKHELMYNRDISECVQVLSNTLACAESDEDFFNIVTEFYKNVGVGLFGLNKAFRISEKRDNDFDFLSVSNMEKVMLCDLVGYHRQKEMLMENTESFLNGKKANNVLLYGDSGTGKSTSIKAIVNEYYSQGLRMIEIYKHQFKYISGIISRIKNRGYKFIIYMDDLSFEDNETEYKYLKAVMEGGVETKPDNILIYATSNRRHLIKETWNDKNDMEHSQDLHRSDTVEEKMSLVNRFGVKINYGKPTPPEYLEIVDHLAKLNGINEDPEELHRKANAWGIRNGGISGRTAEQFIHHIIGSKN